MWKIAYLIFSYFLLCVFCFPFFFRVTHQETTVKPCWSSAEGKINTFTSLWLLQKKKPEQSETAMVNVSLLPVPYVNSELQDNVLFFTVSCYMKTFTLVCVTYMVPTGRCPPLWWGQSVIYASIKCFVLYENLIWTFLFFSKWGHKNEVEDSVSFHLPNRARPFRAVSNKTMYLHSLFLSVSQLIAYVCAQLLLARLRVERGKKKKRCLCGKEIPRKPPKSKATNKACSSHSRCFKWHSQPVTCHHI